jgi:hypothetical protein
MRLLRRCAPRNDKEKNAPRNDKEENLLAMTKKESRSFLSLRDMLKTCRGNLIHCCPHSLSES